MSDNSHNNSHGIILHNMKENCYDIVSIYDLFYDSRYSWDIVALGCTRVKVADTATSMWYTYDAAVTLSSCIDVKMPGQKFQTKNLLTAFIKAKEQSVVVFPSLQRQSTLIYRRQSLHDLLIFSTKSRSTLLGYLYV